MRIKLNSEEINEAILEYLEKRGLTKGNLSSNVLFNNQDGSLNYDVNGAEIGYHISEKKEENNTQKIVTRLAEGNNGKRVSKEEISESKEEMTHYIDTAVDNLERAANVIEADNRFNDRQVDDLNKLYDQVIQAMRILKN